MTAENDHVWNHFLVVLIMIGAGLLLLLSSLACLAWQAIPAPVVPMHGLIGGSVLLALAWLYTKAVRRWASHG
jgi:hypothetical protein